MSCYSVEIDAVRLGQDVIVVPPTIKKNLTSIVREYLKTIQIQDPNLSIALRPDGLDLYVGRQVHSITTPSAQSVARKLRAYFYHHAHAEEPSYIETERSQMIVDDLYKGAPKGLRGRFATGLDVVSNASTACQKAQQASDLLQGKALSISDAGKAFGFLNGGIWAGLGVSELYTGAQDLKNSCEIGDREGQLRAKARVWSARAVLVGAVFDVADQVTHFATSSSAAQVATKGLEVVAANFFGWSSLIGIAMALLTLFRCFQFRDRLLIDYLDNGKALDGSNPEKIRAAVKWLQDQVGVSAEDRKKLREEIVKEGVADPNVINEELDQRISRLAQKKLAYFKRRTSLKSARLVLEATAPGKVLTIQEANNLIQEVLGQNQKKILLNIVTIAAAILGLAALISGSLMGMQTLSYILYASSTGAYAVIGFVGLFSALVWRDNEAPLNGFPALEFIPTHTA